MEKKKKNKFSKKEKNEIKYLLDSLKIPQKDVENMYLYFNKNLNKCLKYYHEEISNITLISKQIGTDLETAKELYYDNNKDIVTSITNFLENSKNTSEKEEDRKNPIFDKSNTNTEEVFEQGKFLTIDKNNGNAYDTKNNYKYVGNIKTIKNKKNIFKNLRNIADNKDNIMNEYLKKQKKEKYIHYFNEEKRNLEKMVEKKIEIYNSSLEFRKKKEKEGIMYIKQIKKVLLDNTIQNLYAKYKHTI